MHLSLALAGQPKVLPCQPEVRESPFVEHFRLPGLLKRNRVTELQRSINSLSRHGDHWSSLFQDQWLLTIIKHGLDFISTEKFPLGSAVAFSVNNLHSLRQEVDNRLLQSAIETVKDQVTGFYSRIFLMKKPDGSFRPIIYLSRLNKNVIHPKFKMDNLATVMSAVLNNVWAVSIYLKDGFFMSASTKPGDHCHG